jgi:hypothetical protein
MSINVPLHVLGVSEHVPTINEVIMDLNILLICSCKNGGTSAKCNNSQQGNEYKDMEGPQVGRRKIDLFSEECHVLNYDPIWQVRP